MNVAISAESTIDLPKELREKYKIKTVPFTITMGNKEFLDGEMKTSEIFDFVKQNNILPKTSAVNEEQYRAHFKTLLKENDAIVHITLPWSRRISPSVRRNLRRPSP